MLDPVLWLGRARGRRGRPAAGRPVRARCDVAALGSPSRATRDVGRVRLASCGPTTRSAPSSRSRARRHRARARHPDAHRRRAGGRAARVDFAEVGVDAMTVTGHKLGGPIGVGALLLGRAGRQPLLHGGGQERDVRSGTLDAPAVARPSRWRPQSTARRPRPPGGRADALRDRLVDGILASVPDAIAQRSTPTRPAARATPTCPSRAARATRCSCCSTPAGSSARRAPPARPGSRSRATC